ncbi:MAG: hypothetical protein AAGE05_07845 [Pseudomonadota bacterium]
MGGDGADENTPPLKRWSGNVALIGGMLTVLFTALAGLNQCSRDNREEFTTFRTAVEAERLFWRDLFDNYLDTYDRELNSPERVQRQIALTIIACNRDAPEFREYQLGFMGADNRLRTKANESISALRSAFLRMADSAETSSPRVRRALERCQFDRDSEAVIQPRENGVVPEEVQQQVSRDVQSANVSSGPVVTSIETLTLSAGDPAGWAVDVFWCRSPDEAPVETANFSLAQRTGVQLAERADAETRLSDRAGETDMTIGRVRVRPLPVSRQGGLYPSLGDENQVRGEPNEQAEVRLLANILNTDQTPFAWRARNASPTSRYLSVFVCADGRVGSEAS